MDSFLAWLRDFWVHFGPWIGMALIPTIITGLSLSPKTLPAAKVVQQIWDIVKQLLSYVSVATFKDEPGTFQTPVLAAVRRGHKLKTARRALKAAKDRNDDLTPTSPGGPGLAMALICLFSLAQTSCCAWTGTCTGKAGKIAGDVIDCGREAVKKEVANLLPTILAIITGGSINWERQLDAIKTLGTDAVACALIVVAKDLQTEMMSQPPASPGHSKTQTDYQKTQDYLDKNNLKPTNAEK